jgi:hypothetical protein
LSSEKHDMKSQTNDIQRPERATGEVREVTTLELPLRCVWTSQPHHQHSCRERIPVRAVAGAWRRELKLGCTKEGGFFNFLWQGEVWLAYGMADGTVRGVYCPAHRAEREQRLGYDPQLVLEPEPVFAATAAASAS